MAKKKDDVKVESITNFRDKLRKDIISKYGEGIIKEASDLVNDKQIVIPVSPAIDRGLNGGVPEGSWCIFSGPPKFGKTTLALQLAANAQKPEYGGKQVYYLDVEGRFKNMNLTTVSSFQPDKCEHIRSIEGKILTAEDFLTIGMDIIKGHPGCVLIIDSASQLCSSKEIVADITASARADGPKLLSSFTKQMGNVVPIQKTIVIIIQHLIANTSGYGPTMMEDGGNKIKYQVDVKLRGKGLEKWMDKENNQIGQIIKWDVVCSALGKPGSLVESYVRYGYGVDETMELIQLATDFGIINKAGAWYSFDMDGEEIKAQGLEKMGELLRESKEKWDYVNNLVTSI